MSNSILDMIMGQLGGDSLKQAGAKAGVDENQAKTGLSAAIPLLLGQMQRNSAEGEGARALSGALAKDHDGSILDNIGGFLGNPQQGNGAGILKHVLGGKRDAVEQKLAGHAGVAKGSAGSLLEMAAPLVMGALGRQQREGGFDMGQLSSFLGGEREKGEKSAGIMGMVEGFLDADKDGSIIDDLAGMAGNLFGKK